MKPRDYRIPLLDADLSLQLMINPYKYFCITDQGKEIGKESNHHNGNFSPLCLTARTSHTYQHGFSVSTRMTRGFTSHNKRRERFRYETIIYLS